MSCRDSKPLSRLEGGPEKAGVGGSIPSLATTYITLSTRYDQVWS
jgi:hypothetical protein